MSGDLKFKVLNKAHRGVLRVTRGRFGWRLMGMEVVQLTTTGRRSGEERTVMLTSPVQVGDTVVVIASRGGEDRHPAWYLNLSADPNVRVSRRRRPAVPMIAREAEPEERERLWPQILKVYRSYGSYQQRTDREIPVVILEPASPSSAGVDAAVDG